MFVIIQSTRSPDQICSRVLKECSVFFFGGSVLLVRVGFKGPMGVFC